MNVLLAGGRGLIGSYLQESLVKDGNQVWVLTRNPHWKAPDQNVNPLVWDARSLGDWAESLNQMDAVINLVGENLSSRLWTRRQRERLRNSRVEAGQALVNAIRQAKRRPSVLLQSSAVGIYGLGTKDRVLKEDSPLGTDFLAQVAREWENSTLEVESLGIRRVVFRTGLVLAPQSIILDRLALPFRLFIGGPLGSGKQWYPWVHYKDEVRAILFLMRNPEAKGAFNLSSPNPERNAALGRKLGKALHRPYWIPVPAFALRLVLGEMSTLVLDGQRAVPDRLLSCGFEFQYPELTAALADIV